MDFNIIFIVSPISSTLLIWDQIRDGFKNDINLSLGYFKSNHNLYDIKVWKIEKYFWI